MAKSRGIGKGRNTKNQPIIANPEIRGSNKAKLNRYQKEELVTKIIQWTTDGLNRQQCKDLVLKNAPAKLTDDDATELIRFAIARFEEITKQDAHVIIANHVEKYEKIIAYFTEIGNTVGLNKAMKAKEDLLKVVKGNKIVVDEKRTTTIVRNVKYNENKLTPEEKELFKQLAEKSHKV